MAQNASRPSRTDTARGPGVFAAPGIAQPLEALVTVWQRFRIWRQSRPFWGGLFAVLSGLEFILSMNLELEGGTISLGQEGFPQYLIAFLMIVCGALAWYTPAQRH